MTSYYRVLASWKISTPPVDAPVAVESYTVEGAVWGWVKSLVYPRYPEERVRVEYVDTYVTPEGRVVTRFRVKLPKQGPRLIDVTLGNTPSDPVPSP